MILSPHNYILTPPLSIFIYDFLSVPSPRFALPPKGALGGIGFESSATSAMWLFHRRPVKMETAALLVCSNDEHKTFKRNAGLHLGFMRE